MKLSLCYTINPLTYCKIFMSIILLLGVACDEVDQKDLNLSDQSFTNECVVEEGDCPNQCTAGNGIVGEDGILLRLRLQRISCGVLCDTILSVCVAPALLSC